MNERNTNELKMFTEYVDKLANELINSLPPVDCRILVSLYSDLPLRTHRDQRLLQKKCQIIWRAIRRARSAGVAF